MTVRRPRALRIPVMAELTWLTVFLAGLLGSTHCLSMCGGIAVSLGAAAGSAGGRASRIAQPLVYNLGRIASYTTAGAIAGALGAAAGLALSISRWSEVLRLATALVVDCLGDEVFAGAAFALDQDRRRFAGRDFTDEAKQLRHLL